MSVFRVISRDKTCNLYAPSTSLAAVQLAVRDRTRRHEGLVATDTEH